LGADEFGFATAPLIAAGCIMMRKCHLNTCPVGVATQDPVLRKRFTGQPEHIINYFFFVAEEVRELMAELGYRTFNEMIGQMQMFDQQKLIAQGKASGLDLSKLFVKPDMPKDVATYNREQQDHKIHDILDHKLIAQSKDAIERGVPVQLSFPIRNVNRTVGAMLSGEIAKRYGHDGLPADTIVTRFTGTAGQSFGAFLAHGVTFELEGDANDYVGKSLSGGRIVVRPPAQSGIVPEQSIIVGNTVLYGAVEGECYFRGVAGERFAVRNSGAVAVIEGAGDHCCEYMTGGVVIVLGPTGRNFAAGMSGGVAYVLDGDATFASRCNMAMVELEPMPGEEDINSRIFHQSRDLEAHGMVDINADMSRFDAHRLHHFISRHARFTGSEIAAKILAEWKTWYPKFHKVMPVEYRRALNEMKAAAIAAE
jgi:glutamate synthase (NADPH/NADH) large chain